MHAAIRNCKHQETESPKGVQEGAWTYQHINSRLGRPNADFKLTEGEDTRFTLPYITSCFRLL